MEETFRNEISTIDEEQLGGWAPNLFLKPKLRLNKFMYCQQSDKFCIIGLSKSELAQFCFVLRNSSSPVFSRLFSERQEGLYDNFLQGNVITGKMLRKPPSETSSTLEAPSPNFTPLDKPHLSTVRLTDTQPNNIYRWDASDLKSKVKLVSYANLLIRCDVREICYNLNFWKVKRMEIKEFFAKPHSTSNVPRH